MPNIEGHFGMPNKGDIWSLTITPPFEYVDNNPSTMAEQNFSGAKKGVNFDASTSNPIYGSSETVTPESLSTKFFIKF